MDDLQPDPPKLRRPEWQAVKATRRLALAFWGAPDGSPHDMERVGTAVIAAFRAHGFAVDWDGTSATRPVVDLSDTATSG
jgi:hypothetical protein